MSPCICFLKISFLSRHKDDISLSVQKVVAHLVGQLENKIPLLPNCSYNYPEYS